MKYFLDTEFIEGDIPLNFFGFNIPKWLIIPNNTIQLISIALVSDDNRKYYAISNEFNLKEAWNRYDLKENKETFIEGTYKNYTKSKYEKVYWIRENVLKPIWEDYLKNQNVFEKTYFWNLTSEFSYKTMKRIIKWTGKSNKQIAEEVKEFVGFPDYEYQPKTSIGRGIEKAYPEFYVYYGDYDWVVFCWIFGKMVNLPNGFPYYAKDLKQIMDEKFKCFSESEIELIKNRKLAINTQKALYPKQTNEHNALSDSIFIKDLHYFLQQL